MPVGSPHVLPSWLGLAPPRFQPAGTKRFRFKGAVNNEMEMRMVVVRVRVVGALNLPHTTKETELTLHGSLNVRCRPNHPINRPG